MASKTQEKLGTPSDRVRAKVLDHLDEVTQDFIRQSPFAVLSTSNAHGDCDASPRGGKPGFVNVIDEKHLFIPDIAGNKLFQSYGNIETSPKAGLVFMIPGVDLTFRVNGTVTIIDRDHKLMKGLDAEVATSDANTRLQQGLLLEVNEAYIHCPRSFTFADLWNTQVINIAKDENATHSWGKRWSEGMKKEQPSET